MNTLAPVSFAHASSDAVAWTKCRLGDIAQKANSGLAQGDLDLKDHGYPAYGASGFIGYTSTYHMEESFIAIVKDGAGVGRTISCPAKSSAIGTLDSLVAKGGCSTEFLGILLSIIDFRRFKSGSTIPHIYFKDYKDVIVALPPEYEQSRICRTFASLNSKIDTLKAKKSALKDYKRGLMQKLFSREIRFTQDIAWRKVPFKEVFDVISPRNGKLKASEYLSEGKIPVVDQGCGLIAGYTNCDHMKNEVGPVVIFGDHTTHVKFVEFPFVAGADGTKILKPVGADPVFLFYFLLFAKPKQEGYKRHFGILSELMIPLPEDHVQNKIGRILRSIDEKKLSPLMS